MLPFLAVVLHAKSVDLRLKIVPVSEAIAALGQASGMRLETDKKVAERKITLLLHHADPQETMARIADVMRLAWEKERSGALRLVPDTILENRERAHIEAERADSEGNFEESLRKMAAEVSVDPDARAKREKDAKDAFVAFSAPGDAWAMRKAFERYSDARARPTPFGVALASLDAAGWRALMAGQTMIFSAGPNPLGRPIGHAAIDLMPRYKGNPEILGLTILARFGSDGGPGGVATFTRSEYGWGGSAGGGASAPSLPRHVLRSRLTDELDAWNEPELTGPESARTLDAKTEERPLEWSLGAVNSHVPRSTWNVSDSDRLEWLHDASGLDIVARADRIASSIGQRRFEGTVADFVRDWRKGQVLWMRDAFRLVGRTLMFRPGRYWQRTFEPPESTLRAFEAIKRPSLDDWADFASRLTDGQASYLAYGVTLLRRPADPLASAPALRFWAGLTPAQRIKAREKPLGADDLDPSQRQACLRTMLGMAFRGRCQPDALPSLLSGDPAVVRFALPSGGGTRIDGSGEDYDWTMTFGPGRVGVWFAIGRPADASGP